MVIVNEWLALILFYQKNFRILGFAVWWYTNNEVQKKLCRCMYKTWKNQAINWVIPSIDLYHSPYQQLMGSRRIKTQYCLSFYGHEPANIRWSISWQCRNQQSLHHEWISRRNKDKCDQPRGWQNELCRQIRHQRIQRKQPTLTNVKSNERTTANVNAISLTNWNSNLNVPKQCWNPLKNTWIERLAQKSLQYRARAHIRVDDNFSRH